MPPLPDWTREFPAPITVCDAQGVVLYMNLASQRQFANDGGAALIGQNLMACHPGESGDKLRALLENPRVNLYTIEKNGRKKMIHQSPWFQDGQFAGLVEMTLELPAEVPHFVRR
jgi:transcriptional regulator with PAS, ATPase and Fis domain